MTIFGKRVDKEIGLIYFGYRYYDPEDGRWISPDPLGTIDGPNLYVYACNNPMTYIDYFGLATDINENQSCVCGHCVRNEVFCHCRGEDPTNDIQTCACRGILCNHKNGRSIVIIGSNIRSAIGGIGHGVVDFVIGSFHDLQTAAVYMGSGELEMSLHERTLMIEAVENSQANQIAKVEGWMLDMLSIDQSDTVYQSFRSKTTMGLEISSLVAGGYGAVKGVMAFNRLAKVPMQIIKAAKTVSRLPSNPLQGTKYTQKVLRQMQPNLKTGHPDFHGFPHIVDNYANLGRKELITGRDGITRIKVSLEGGYQGQEGCFEWIVESDKLVNHRLFIPNP